MTPLRVEEEVRTEFNKLEQTRAKKATLLFGKERNVASHEFDLYEKNKVIGGISTSPWFNKKRTSNTGGQDRAAAELLWLSLWHGRERRIHILTDEEMAKRLYKKFSGAIFQRNIEIHHFDLQKKKFSHIGTL